MRYFHGRHSVGDDTLWGVNRTKGAAQTRAPQAYLCRRNANSRHPRLLAAERKERARIRSEKDIRWGGRPVAGAV